MAQPLPIDAVLPKLCAVIAAQGQAVLQAPPGAGKTTRVPLALLEQVAGRILMLEPRRLAARAAAERMAETLGEPVGATVGYRIRGEAKVGAETRIEVVTEGILTRMIQSDPDLPGVGAILFDEFHERSLNADLGLALALEIRSALRPDLILLPMSATLDAAPVAALMGGAPVITAEGRSFPVEVKWRERPLPKGQRLAAAVADLVAEAVAETEGGVLVFLPGEGEIRAVQGMLTGRFPETCEIRPLFGAMPFAAQRAAIAALPDPRRRKIVLSTSIAETSLTIEDIRVVVDAGQSRRARFDPGSGMSRLVTEKVSRAEATQRSGRAGRVAPGVSYRLWTKGEDGALAGFAPAEIEAADLAGLALELAQWGSADLAFLTPPPEAAMAEARALLRALWALTAEDRITDHGRALAALPLHPRLAHMLMTAGPQAAPLAALLGERDPLPGAGADLGLRLGALSEQRPAPDASRAALARIRTEAKRLARGLPQRPAMSPAEMAALAYPDRIGQRRPGDEPRYLLSGGRGAVIRSDDALAQARFIVATDLDGGGREAKVRQALRIEESEIRALMGDQIGWETICAWSRRDGRVVTRKHEKLGALVLADQPWPDAPPEAMAQAMCDGVRQLGLRLSGAAARFRARVELVRAGDADLPDMRDAALLDGLEDWLAPHLSGVRSAEDWKGFNPLPALQAMLDWGQTQRLNEAAPAAFTTPLDRKIPIDYDGETPSISLRLQEMFGVTQHPMIGNTPLRVTLLSPGHKPVQVTTDIPGFWVSSYADVRKDMRGRYPKHNWPEDPTVAEPTLRARRKP
ncbi:ATP-dependent helicase HrpB [Flavimaricola marinus]|uniref:ATP-dependent RNA helicase HrpB n=1 Tax=Flavimaricola marinus TaxID=1819565 RepID=A0A238LGT4_9RHOB|nr:ATP-dependent helicase HrpB [Flavimaricola marinus]SMY08624.1 ATP-dependent RNA helicase HrpB [Flavimaricola marinus]